MKPYLFFKRGLLAAGVSGSLLAYSQVHKIDNKVAYIKERLDANEKLPLLELSTQESATFPWEFNPSSLEKDDWEFRRVQVKGGIYSTRHFVRKDKGDQPGYLVFAAMPTAQHVVKDLHIGILSEPYIGAQRGIVVCLGWVPMEATATALSDDVVRNEVVILEDLYASSKRMPSGRVIDTDTGFHYQSAVIGDESIPGENLYDDYDNPDMAKTRVVLAEAVMNTEGGEDVAPDIEPLSIGSEMHYWAESKVPTYQGYLHMKGYLRKGEEDDWLLGRYNKGTRDVNKVDIAKIAGFYRFRNPSAYEYYIDRSTDSDEIYNNTLPQPNHLNKGFEHLEPFEKDAYYDGYKRLLKYSSALAIIGLLI